jgi:hypothetical protein
MQLSPLKVILFDLMGNELHENTPLINGELEFDDLKNGIYFPSIFTSQWCSTKKIIIEK